MLEEKFKEAQQQVQTLKERPSNENLLELYALFKQATVGDVEGERPGFMDLKGRAKYDAWETRKGMEKERAMQSYVDLVEKLLSAQ